MCQDAPFFTVKLQVQMLPCLVLFCNGVAIDRIAGFDELGAKDDFPTIRFPPLSPPPPETHKHSHALSCLVLCSKWDVLLCFIRPA